MISGIMTGKQFYYADRNNKKVIESTVLNVRYGYPTMIVAQNNESKEIFRCYNGNGCYEIDEYDEAFKDAQIEGDRIIY